MENHIIEKPWISKFAANAWNKMTELAIGIN